jgi:hypothetical protein
LGSSNLLNTPITYQVSLKNKNDSTSTGMALLLFRVPSCLSIDYNLIEELVQNQVIDSFELRNHEELILYWRGIEPEGIRNVSI